LIADRASQHAASAQPSVPEVRCDNAPDGWDSARFLKLFLSYESFPFPNTWAKSIRIKWPQREERITIGEVLEIQARHVVQHLSDIQMICRVYKL
jgi:hypothetical protein